MRNAKGRNKERRTGGRILVVGVVLLTLCIHSSDAFIKAAIGLRIGYSPTEKGYGQPLQLNGLHSKNPAIKGQFLTGVHDTPPHGKSAGVEASPAHGGARGSGLLHHLKILGVNLYLGGPKPSHHGGGGGGGTNNGVHGHTHPVTPQFVGRPPTNLQPGGGGLGGAQPPPPVFPPHHGGHQGQLGGTSPEERHRDLLRGQGPRGQYSSLPQVGGELRGIDEQNEIGGGSGYSFPAGGGGGGSAEVFQPAASQYPTYHHNLNVLQNPNQKGPFFTHATPPLLPHQQQQQQHHHQLGPLQNVQHQQPRPQHAGPPPPPLRQGFSLASLMRGPQWTSRPRLFRVPLVQFGRSHPPPPPQMSGPMIPAQSSSSPRVQYSTLFSTNPTNAPPPQHQQVFVMPTSASSMPHFIHPAPQQHDQPPRPFSTYPYAPHPQMPGFPQQQQQIPMGGGGGQSYASSNYFPTTLNSSPQNMNPFLQQPHPQAQTMPNFGHHQNGRPEFHHQTPPQQNDFYQQQPPPQNNNNNEYNDEYSRRPSGMPDDMRPPPGFEYSHTDSSPIVSMGMTSYDDPPVMMDDNNRPGDHKQREEVEASPPRQNNNHQQQGNHNFESALPEGMREISQDEYNAFLTAPTNIHTSHVSTQVMPPSPPIQHPRSYDPFLQQQQGHKSTPRSGHLTRSLLHWNSLLDKYPAAGGIKREISRSYEMVDSDTQGTQASPTIAVPTEKEKVPPKKRLGVHIRARRTTTTTTTTAATPTKTTANNITPAQLTTN